MAQSPLWRLNVKALGYAPLPWRWDEKIRMTPPLPPLSFVGGDTIALTFVTPGEEPGLARRGQPSESLPYRLQSIFVDATMGKARGRSEWPTASDRAGIVPAGADGFVVVTPDRLALYSSDLRLLKQLDLSLTDLAQGAYWLVSPSPDGKCMVIMYAGRSDEYSYLWLNLDGLQMVRSWTEDGHKNVWKGSEPFMVRGGDFGAIYDHRMVIPFPPEGFLIRELDGPWRLVHARTLPGLVLAFLNREVLFSLGQGGEFSRATARLTLVRTDGEVLLDQTFPRRQLVRRTASSSDGRRLAVALDLEKGGSAVLDIAPHYSLSRVIVYDLSAREWVYSLDGKSQGIKSISGLALSPNGSQLALINQDGILEVYRLPDPTGVATSR